MTYNHLMVAIIINFLSIQISYSTDEWIPFEDSEEKCSILRVHEQRLHDSAIYPFNNPRILKEAAEEIVRYVQSYEILKAKIWDRPHKYTFQMDRDIPKYTITKTNNGNAGADVYLFEDDFKRVHFAVKTFKQDLLEYGAIEIGNSLLASALFKLNQNLSCVPLKVPSIIRVGAQLGEQINDVEKVKEVAYMMEGAWGKHIGYYYQSYLETKNPNDFNYIWRELTYFLAWFHLSWKPFISDGLCPGQKDRNQAYGFYIKQHTKSFKRLYTRKPLKSIIKQNLKYLNEANIIPETYYKNIKECFFSVHQQFNKENSSFQVLDKLGYFTMTHGDLHLDNLLLAIIGKELYVTFIDYGTMMKTYKLIGDPAENIGRLIGSLWVYTAKHCTANQDLQAVFSRVHMWQEQFIENYLYYSSMGDEVSTLFRHNVDFFKLRFFKVVLSYNNHPVEGINFKSYLLYFILMEFRFKQPDLMKGRE